MIKIDKSIGNWIPDEQHSIFSVKYIDDIAYHLYCQYRKLRKKENISHQMVVILHKKVYKKFYQDAELIIRVEKIMKVYKNNN